MPPLPRLESQEVEFVQSGENGGPQLVVDHGLDPAASLPPAFKDLAVIKIVYDKINALRKDDDVARPFAEYAECCLAPYLDNCHTSGQNMVEGRTVVFFSFELARPDQLLGTELLTNSLRPYYTDWCCRLYDDFTICEGIYFWSKYDGAPLVKIADN